MKKILFLLLGVTLLTNCSKDEEVLTGNISGFVSDYTNANKAIAGATITLNNKGLTKTTGSDGRFEFNNLEPGTYTLSVQANSFQPTSKQVTVYAGQNVTCDFQLEQTSASVALSTQNLVFGANVDQLSFTIDNNDNRALSYTLTNVPDFLEASPNNGTISAKGTQAVSVKVLNRTAITTSRSGQMTVNVGNSAFVVSISVEPYRDEAVSVDINPQSLSFDKDTEQLTFTMTSNYSKELDYTITSNLDILNVSPSSGTLGVRGTNQISVTVNDRKNVTTNRTGSLTITMGGNTYVVNVSVAKYEESNPDEPINQDDVVNGLYAYFTFENHYNDITETGLSGTGIGTSFVDSYNGGKALYIPANSSSYLTIPDPLIDHRQMSISFWVKDLYDGHVFHAVRSSDNGTSFLLAVENGMLKFVAHGYNIRYSYSQRPTFTHNTLSGWHMVTITSDLSNAISYNTITTRLYVDGVYVDMVSENPGTEGSGGYSNNYNACMKFIMGGAQPESRDPNIPATKLTIDNLRVYNNRQLSADEVKRIYNIEKP